MILDPDDQAVADCPDRPHLAAHLQAIAPPSLERDKGEDTFATVRSSSTEMRIYSHMPGKSLQNFLKPS